MNDNTPLTLCLHKIANFVTKIWYIKVEQDLTAIEPKSTDLKEFELLYNSLNTSLERYADYFVGDLELARTIVNDLFVQLWFKSSKPENLNGYLYRAVKNACLNHLQQHKKNPLSFIGNEDLTKLSDLSENPFTLTNDAERLVFLDHVIAQLPEKRQLVFRMHRLEGFTYAEIADLLQISARTVEDHLSKAMQFIHSYAKDFLYKNLTEA
ncbi:MAG: sigma-70 family RNA polymerase sigma factor [Pedobacter sp.]|nr:MAG: sigma-70 family RNA polymerase sigma factor [Pedobacter sp.]